MYYITAAPGRMRSYTFTASASDSSEPIGRVTLLIDAETGEGMIHDLFVAEAHRRQGIGTELVKRAVRQAVAIHKHPNIVLHCTEALAPFYTRLGFTVRGAEVHLEW